MSTQNKRLTHHQILLSVALQCARKGIDFVPAKWVKKLRRFPLDYRKRLSELQREGQVQRGGLDERFAIFFLTKKGLGRARLIKGIL